jgi:hypothetical protein
VGFRRRLRLVNRLKQFRAVATRYDKTGESFLAFVHLAASRLWLLVRPHGLVVYSGGVRGTHEQNKLSIRIPLKAAYPNFLILPLTDIDAPICTFQALHKNSARAILFIFATSVD